MPHLSVKSSISGGYIFSFISFAILQFSPALKKWVYHYHSSSSSEVFWTKNSKHIKKEASVTLSFYYILIQFCLFWSMTINFVWSRFHYSQIVHFLQNYYMVYSVTYFINCVKIVQIQSFSWSVFSCICTEYGDGLHEYLYSVVQIQEYMDQKKLLIWTLFTPWSKSTFKSSVY